MKKIFLLLVIYSLGLFAQPNFLKFIDKVNSTQDNNLKSLLVDSLMISTQQKGLPLLEGNYAIFLWRGSASSVQLAGDFNNWGSPVYSLSLLSGTNLFYYKQSFESDARLDYKLVVNGNWILDPGNPHTCAGGFGPNSELAMSGYVQPWEILYKPNIKHGTLVEDTIRSQIVNRTYKLKIFIPVEYFYLSSPLPTVYFQDGEDYLNLGYAKNVIDNILDSGKVVPFIGVFVQPNDRNEEYAYSLRNYYSRFFVEELVPYIDKTFRTIKNPAQRLVLGDSFGGNISALISFTYPEIFGNCGQQSGAFWPNDYEVQKLFLNNPKKNIKMFSVWGTYESLFSDWRPLMINMIPKGYQLQWKEYHEGHSWGQWRATLDDLLTYFFPKNVTAVEIKNNPLPSVTHLNQNYPNPLNPSTIISFEIPKDQKVKVDLFNTLGQFVKNIIDQYLASGSHTVSFDASFLPSGLYFYRLSTDNIIETKKMILQK